MLETALSDQAMTLRRRLRIFPIGRLFAHTDQVRKSHHAWRPILMLDFAWRWDRWSREAPQTRFRASRLGFHRGGTHLVRTGASGFFYMSRRRIGSMPEVAKSATFAALAADAASR